MRFLVIRESQAISAQCRESIQLFQLRIRIRLFSSNPDPYFNRAYFLGSRLYPPPFCRCTVTGKTPADNLGGPPIIQDQLMNPRPRFRYD